MKLYSTAILITNNKDMYMFNGVYGAESEEEAIDKVIKNTLKGKEKFNVAQTIVMEIGDLEEVNDDEVICILNDDLWEEDDA